jgi:hypothetical protein
MPTIAVVIIITISAEPLTIGTMECHNLTGETMKEIPIRLVDTTKLHLNTFYNKNHGNYFHCCLFIWITTYHIR